MWEPGDASFWSDPHIGEHVLRAHLDPNTEQASRNPRTIDRTVKWIIKALSLSSKDRLLDLGCGPGLYCSRFFKAGLQVTGIDYSPVSVAHARKSDPEILFHLGNYLEMDFPGEFDVIILIYGDFCVLSNRDRDRLLDRIHGALRPGGVFVTDVFTEYYVLREGFHSDWHVHREGGFWNPGPHLVLEQSFHYPRRRLAVDQYVVVDPAGTTIRYHVWKHYYTRQSIRRVLRSAGFAVEGLYGDLEGTAYDPLTEWIGVIARRS